MNAALAIQLLLQLLSQAQSLGTVIKRAREEGRDVTDEELDELAALDDSVRDALRAEIARQRAGTGG